MKHIFTCVIFLLSFVYFGVNSTFASGFTLQTIGNSTTGGRQITKWWYTGSQPAFKGEATPGADVVVTIDGNALQVNADSSGNWSFTPVSPLTTGSHSVAIVSGGSTIAFTLSIGTEGVDWDAVGKGGAATLPATGVAFPTILVIGLAVVVMLGGMRLYRSL
jgi:hypothetical protein